MNATDRLTAALVAMAADGGSAPCGEPSTHELWTSDVLVERLVAVALCGPCPVIEVCGAAAEENGDVYVWGGRDYTPVQKSKRTNSSKKEKK